MFISVADSPTRAARLASELLTHAAVSFSQFTKREKRFT